MKESNPSEKRPQLRNVGRQTEDREWENSRMNATLLRESVPSERVERGGQMREYVSEETARHRE